MAIPYKREPCAPNLNNYRRGHMRMASLSNLYIYNLIIVNGGVLEILSPNTT